MSAQLAQRHIASIRLGAGTQSSNVMGFADRRIPIVIRPTILGNVKRFGPADPGLNNSVSPNHSLLG